MRKKRKTIILIVSSIVVVAVVVAILIASLNRPHLTNSAERNTILLNETFPSDIIVYGEDFYVPDYYKDVKYRRVTSLNETTLASSDDFIYSFIVIIDSEGKLILSDEELDLIKRLIDEKYYSMFYFGTNSLDLLCEKGFLKPEYKQNIEYGFMYGNIFGSAGIENAHKRMMYYGVRAKEQYMETFVSTIAHFIKLTNKLY